MTFVAKRRRGAVFTWPLLALLLAGCISSEQAIQDETDIARRYLPTTRQVQHPDSLTHVTLKTGAEQLKLTAAHPYGQLRRLWSAGFLNANDGQHFQTSTFKTFATLWSRELFIVETNRTLGLQTLSRDLAQRQLEERLATHEAYVEFRVYVFVNEQIPEAFAHTRLDALGSRIRLTDQRGNAYAPARIVSHVADRTNSGPPPNAFHRANTIYFKRHVEGQDILTDVERLELSIQTSRPVSAKIVFAWAFGL